MKPEDPGSEITYRHQFKAGNVGDVWKHVALGLLGEAALCGPGPHRVLETHAGAGRYTLDSTGEWTAGIGRLDAAPALPEVLRRYHEAAGRRQVNRGGWYPGSPRFLRNFLRNDDRLTLVELLDEPRRTLQQHFADDPLVQVQGGDGLAVLAHSRIDLAFIDPPYVEPSEWERVSTAAIGATQAGARVAIWYPIKALTRPAGLQNRIRAAGVSALAVDLITGDLEKKKKALAGSGMLVTRPPVGLAQRWAEAAAALGPILAEGPWSVRIQAW